MKLHWFYNGKVYICYDQNYTRIGGYWYTMNEVRYYAKKYGWNGVKKVSYAFVEKAFDIEQARHRYAEKLP